MKSGVMAWSCLGATPLRQCANMAPRADEKDRSLSGCEWADKSISFRVDFPVDPLL